MVTLKSGEKLIFPSDKFSTDSASFCKQAKAIMGTSEALVFFHGDCNITAEEEQPSNLTW